MEFVATEWLLEFLLQGIQGICDILLFVFFPVKDLCDEIIKFHEDCHNWNYSNLSVSDKHLDILHEFTIPGTILIKELHF